VLACAGIAKPDFYAWETPGWRSANLDFQEYRRLCQRIGIRPSPPAKTKGGVFLLEGKQEDYIDTLLARWQHREPGISDPCVQILSVVYLRWQAAGLQPLLVVNGGSRHRFPGSVTIDLLPTVRYELALDCSTDPAIAQFRRHVQLPTESKWTAVPVMEFQFSGAAFLWLEKTLLSQRHRTTQRLKVAGQHRAREIQRLERAIRTALQQHHEPAAWTN
jgi:hypothetical protein